MFRSPCASNQSTPPAPWIGGEPAERPERDRVVAAQDDRDGAFLGRGRDATRNALAGVLDLGEEARTRVAGRGRLGDRGLDVAPVRALEPEPREAVVQARVADRGGPHVHAATAGAQVERAHR